MEDDATYGEFSAVLAEMIGVLSPLTPPAEIADWHNIVLNLLQTTKSMVDEQPEDNVIDWALLAIAAAFEEMEEEITEIENATPVEIQRRMVEAGCFSSDATPATGPETAEDDHGNYSDNASAVVVGEAIRGNVDYQGDADFFRFTAEAGKFYQIDVVLGTLEDSFVSLWGAHGEGLRGLARNDDYGDSLASRIIWEAPESGDYYAEVTGYGTGAYTLTVALSEPAFILAPTLSLDEYLLQCAMLEEAGIELENDTTYGEFSAALAEMIEVLWTLTPPAEIADWHNSVLNLLQTAKSMVEEQPEETVIGLEFFEIAAAFEVLEEEVTEIENRMPAQIRQRMDAAGCLSDSGDATAELVPETGEDDHGNDIQNATAIAVGEAVVGVVDYQGDNDFFRFRAMAGRSYRIDVALGTLQDSEAAVLDADDQLLEYNDDHGDSLASRIIWEAPSSGYYFIGVGGVEFEHTGAYTLTVAVSDITDDHGNSVLNATAIAVGEEVVGVVDYPGDNDFFRFRTMAGRSYRIDVALGTLQDSEVTVLDTYDELLEYNDDHGDSLASRIVWEAPSSGHYFIGVGGVEFEHTGTYTLTVTVP